MRLSLDRSLFLIVFFLLGLGLVQVYSSSFILATENFGDGYYFFRKQVLFAAIALVVMISVAHIPWRSLETFLFSMWVLNVIALIAVLVPGIGHAAGGASRWIPIPGGFRFQPAEFYKCLNIFFVTWMWFRWSKLKSWKPKAAFLAGWIIPLLLILKEPDFGSVVVIVASTFVLFFVLGISWLAVFGTVLTAGFAFALAIWQEPYRLKRIHAYLDPWADPHNKGFQVIQSLLSYKSGGVWGAGLGQGYGKLFFLPEAHTDFTLAVLAEELGFVGVTLVLILFFCLVLRGLQIAWQAKSSAMQSLAFGIIFWIGTTVLINAGVTLGLLPTKGMALPFLSYGGSSLIAVGLGLGIVFNVHRSSQQAKAVKSIFFKGA